MNNPIVHGLVFAAAVVIPGGLIVYWAWAWNRAKKARDLKKEKDLLVHNDQKDKALKAQKFLPEKLPNS